LIEALLGVKKRSSLDCTKWIRRNIKESRSCYVQWSLRKTEHWQGFHQTNT